MLRVKRPRRVIWICWSFKEGIAVITGLCNVAAAVVGVEAVESEVVLINARTTAQIVRVTDFSRIYVW